MIEVKKIMCFVDSSTADSVDLSSGAMSTYKCEDCGNKFKGMGSKLSCPACRSANLKQI